MIRIGMSASGVTLHGTAADELGQVSATATQPIPEPEGPGSLPLAAAALTANLRPAGGLPAVLCLALEGADALSPLSARHRQPLLDNVGLPVLVGPESGCTLMGEWLDGAVTGFHHVVGVFLGRRVNTAVITAGGLLCGAAGPSGEAGHTIFTPGGRQCDCGRRGCFNAYLGQEAMIGRIQELCRERPDSQLANTPEGVNLADVLRAMRQGDVVAGRVWEETVLALRVLVANMVSLFDPEALLLGGSQALACPELQDELHEHLVIPVDDGRLRRVQLRLAAGGAARTALGATRLPEVLGWDT